MKTISKISDLSDYPAVKKLASALHKFDSTQHGAAIMIGAGFSRSAALHVGGEKKMPLWYDFSKSLVEALNPNYKDLIFSDPLRVAEEYRAYFGQASLNDRIRSELDDDAWRPGYLYTSLMELPWSEIMTTNWDTLLERAAKNLHNSYYTPVTKASDLAWAPSPRIVKLHGTIGVTDNFIAAQEDYRTYPERYAPFVNFVRQVFIENELCLLGFSGDDPNFLQWAGWVRDHLADHSRKIYLVGALNLSPPQRKYLESISITPIDLWDAVKHDQDDRDLLHQMATKLFLQAMSDEGKSKFKPYEWIVSDLRSQQKVTQQNNIYNFTESRLRILQKDRESYPGWLVCPPLQRQLIFSQLTYFNLHSIASFKPEDKAKLLYEIAWRHRITFEYIAPWLVDELFKIANPDEPCNLRKHQQMEIALILLNNSRWLEASDETGKKVIEEHIQVLNSILEKHARYLPDCAAELAYHQALVARDRFDYAGIEKAVEKISGEDLVWKLRRAALLIELGRFEEGKQLIARAYEELRENHQRDRYSISILSRLTWAFWLLRAAHNYNSEEKLPTFVQNNYRKWKCDPWVWIEEIQEKVRKRQEDYFKNQNSIEPLFVQGHYKNNLHNSSINNVGSIFLLLEGLIRNVGIPLRSGNVAINVDLLASTAEKMVLPSEIRDELWNYTLAIRAAKVENSPSINRVFTRIDLACASKELVSTLVERMLSAIQYWRKQRIMGSKDQQGHALSVLRVLIEVLARLIIRVPPEKASEIFQLAVSLGQQSNLQHPWLCNAINHLLNYSLESVPKSKQGELLSDALAFPLKSEVGLHDDDSWPNPIISYPNERETYPHIDMRISELIAAVRSNNTFLNTNALVRLFPLAEKDNFLTPIELENLAAAIWGKTPDYQHLPNIINLYPHIFLLLPAPDENKVKSLVQRHLYEHGEDILMDTQKELQSYPSTEIERAVTIYTSMANAAVNDKIKLFPSTEQALRVFEQLLNWRPWKNINDPYHYEANERKSLTNSIGNALSFAIVPALSNKDKTIERFEKLQTFYNEVDEAIAVLPAFVYFTFINEKIACDTEKLIRKALQGREEREVYYAAIALQKWGELSAPVCLSQLTSLITRLIFIVDTGRTLGLQHLIAVARQLYKKGLLNDEQVVTLREAVTNAFSAADYAYIEPYSREAISVSIIRGECVKLATALHSQFPDECSLNNLINKSLTDALPEVRFAIDS